MDGMKAFKDVAVGPHIKTPSGSPNDSAPPNNAGPPHHIEPGITPPTPASVFDGIIGIPGEPT
jgi:hypothetical protein